MTDDTRNLLKSAASNSASVLGYVSTAVTFFPIGEVARPYFRLLGLVLIIVGVFRGAQAVTAEKNNEIEAVKREMERQFEELRTQKDGEIVSLNERIVQLSRKPYAEDLGCTARETLERMSDLGRRVLVQLLKREPVEVGRILVNDAPLEAQHAQLAIAFETGVVRHQKEAERALSTYWVVNPRFRPALEDLLYEK